AAAEHHAEEAQWQANTVYEAHKNQPAQLLEETVARLQSRRRIAEGLARDAQTLMAMRGQSPAAAAYDWRNDPAVNPPDGTLQSPVPPAEERLVRTLEELKQGVLALQDQPLASLFIEGKRWTAWLAG